MDVFEALSDPIRRRMLELLACEDRQAGDFAVAFAHLSQPTLSHHLKVLRNAGLVEVRPAAQRRIYSLRRAPLTEIHEWLERTALYWKAELDALEEHLDALDTEQ